MHIDVCEISQAFGSSRVLEDFSCVIAPRELTVLVGPSGSGKSTLMALMAGFQKPDLGEIHFRRADRTTCPPCSNDIAWVPQGANALGVRSALDNASLSALASGCDVAAAHRRARAQLRRVGLADRVDAPARSLSGGELQRVGFARALVAEKPFIFADEPTSSLDAAATESIVALLHELRETTTIVVATHDSRVVAVAQHLIELRGATAHAR